VISLIGRNWTLPLVGLGKAVTLSWCFFAQVSIAFLLAPAEGALLDSFLAGAPIRTLFLAGFLSFYSCFARELSLF
jgi:hypothetical protein